MPSSPLVRRSAGACATLLGVFVVVGPAAAQEPAQVEDAERPPAAAESQPDEPTMRPRIALRTLFGLGGTADVGGFDDLSLDTSYGGAIELEAPVVEAFSLAAEVAVTSWRPDHMDLGRIILSDVSIVPRLRLPFEGNVIHGALYIGVPVGLSLNFFTNDHDPDLQLRELGLDTGVGYNVGGRVGIQLFPTPSVGLTADVEYRYHRLSHELEGAAAGGDDMDVHLRQLVVQAGLVFAPW